MTVRHAAIVSIPVTDPERAKRFYAEALDFEVRRDTAMGPGQRWLEVAPKGSQTSFTLVTWFDSMPAGSLRGLVLDTADIDRTAAELNAKGVKTSAIESKPWGRYITLSDPDGNGLIIQQAATVS